MLQTRERVSPLGGNKCNECVWIIFDGLSSVSDFFFSFKPQPSYYPWVCALIPSPQPDRSIYLVATKLHNHFANYFLSSDWPQIHPSRPRSSACPCPRPQFLHPYEAISAASRRNQFPAFLILIESISLSTPASSFHPRSCRLLSSSV